MRKHSAAPRAWQGHAAAAAVCFGIGVSCEIIDASANYMFGLTFGGFAPYAFLIAAIIYSTTLAIFGHHGFSWRSGSDWILAALGLLGLAVSVMGGLSSHGARMGAQINATARVEDDVALKKGAYEAARQALAAAEAEKIKAEVAVAEFGKTLVYADLRDAEASIRKTAAGYAAAGKNRGVEGDTFEELCPNVALCRNEMKKLAPLQAQMKEAHAKEAAEAAAAAKTAVEEARRSELREAAAAFEKAKAVRPESSLTDIASLDGGDVSAAARNGAAKAAWVLMLVTVAGAWAAWPATHHLGKAIELYKAGRPESAKTTPKAGSGRKEKSGPDGGKPRKRRPKPQAPSQTIGPDQDGANVIPMAARRADRSPALRSAERALVAHLLAQTSPKLPKNEICRRLKSDYKSSRTTVYRLIREVEEAQAQASQKEAEASH